PPGRLPGRQRGDEHHRGAGGRTGQARPGGRGGRGRPAAAGRDHAEPLTVRYRHGVSMPRRTTLSARLARMGFADPAQAERLAGRDLALDIDSGDIDSGDAGLLAALAAAADPDLALAALARMPRDAELLT